MSDKVFIDTNVLVYAHDRDAGDKRAVPAIALLLDESFPELREASINALRKLQEPTAVPKLQAVALEKSVVSSLATDALAAFPRTPETDAALCAIALDGAVLGADVENVRHERHSRTRST